MSAPPEAAPVATMAAFARGLKAAFTSVFVFVITVTYIGYGALVHDFGFSLPWAWLSTLLIWAAPAQVILVTALGSGAPLFETAITVGLSSVRLLPMVVALLPIIKRPGMRSWQLVLPAHLIAISMWIETMRLAPGVARENRIAFSSGIGIGLIGASFVATAFGFYLAALLPTTIRRRGDLHYADVVSGLGRAQQPAVVRVAGARARLGHRADPGLQRGAVRSAVDRHRRRDHRLCGAAHQVGNVMKSADVMKTVIDPYLALILVGFLPNEIWRWLGVMVGHGLDEESEIILWIRAVATALIAGVIARILLFPPGALASVPLALRLTAIAAGLLAYVLIRRSALAGVLVGEAVLIAGALLY